LYAIKVYFQSVQIQLEHLSETLLKQDVLRVEHEIPHSVHEDLEGGSFWSGLKNIVHKIATVASPILGAVAPEFQGIAEGIKNVTGSGMSQRSGGRLSGGSIRRR
jgi:hypothetical protein